MKKKKAKVFSIFVVFTSVLLVLSLLSFIIYISANRDYYIEYSEKSDLDYKVYLKENDYFKTNYLGKNNKYIANIIDYINADFSYKLLFPDNDIDYKYSYKVIASLSVKDKDDDITYYEYADELYKSDIITSNKNITINKNLNIDYNKYNNLIKSFVKDFDLDRSESSLKVSMYVTLLNNDNEYLNEINNNKVISLNIPLTTKTISIDINSDLQNTEGNKILIKQDGKKVEFLVIGSVLLTCSAIMILFLVIYYFKNRTPLAIYKRRLRSLLGNYSSYIQEIDNTHKIGASIVYKLKSFDDLLEVRDCLQKPILMIHNEKNTGTFFIIPANEYTIYSYALRVVDIVASKKGLDTPDYDVTNLSKETKEEKKFTKTYIETQIDDATRTITMNKLDADNVILGNKNSNENIYEQLEKTTSYKLSDIKAMAKKVSIPKDDKKAVKKEVTQEKVVKIESKPKKVSAKVEEKKPVRKLKSVDKIVKDLVKTEEKPKKVSAKVEEKKPVRKLKSVDKIVKDLVKTEEKPKKVSAKVEEKKPVRKLKSVDKIVKDLVKTEEKPKKVSAKVEEKKPVRKLKSVDKIVKDLVKTEEKPKKVTRTRSTKTTK